MSKEKNIEKFVEFKGEEDLLNQIENMRRQLEKMLTHYDGEGFDDEVIEMSQYLDRLLVAYVKGKDEQNIVEMSISSNQSLTNLFQYEICPFCNDSCVTILDHKEQDLRYLLSHDSLTGLYNRMYFEEEIRQQKHHSHFNHCRRCEWIKADK
ncbi:aspartyl-phosphate phosphatase Spo0E family protein [Alkaliphilus metalliredigens]|uniref:aspartyl-phosphate phosphatase Spo0E family protein n=1 Tax=Alkaliphilus metalliredigens TaxID=208226 RepID=UPI00005CA94A|nr:Spo0E family sporulation regulatory protein-aspartic acid phosphatase [Alkaliphilus metalliredigens]